jgi:hypothetical protein
VQLLPSAPPGRRGDNIGAQYHISDTALGAEALRLVADKVAGGKPLYSFTSTQASKLPDTKAIAVKDTAFNTYYINAVNTGANDARVALGMAAWGVKSGWPVIVERVNAVNYGEVTEILAANSTGGVFVVSGGGGCARTRAGHACCGGTMVVSGFNLGPHQCCGGFYDSQTAACLPACLFAVCASRYQ